MNADVRSLVWSTAHWGKTESTVPELDQELMKLLLENISTRIAVVGLEAKENARHREKCG